MLIGIFHIILTLISKTMKTSFFLRNILLLMILVGFQSYSQSYFKKFISLSHIKDSTNADSYNFSPVLSAEYSSEVEKQLKGKFRDRGTFFLAYVSEQQEETVIMELKDSKNSVSITNRNIILSDGNENKIEPYDGSILSYSFSRGNYGRKNNGAFINRGFISEENKILEFLYIPDVISARDREKIQTYLSIKYGISLYDSYYIASAGDTIWSPENNKGFEHRVTGIGRDDDYGLYQKKSINSVSKEFVVGIDSTEIINNNNFLLWSDNGNPAFLKGSSSKEKISAIDKMWKLNLFGEQKDFRNISIMVIPEMLFEKYDNRLEKTDDVLWLVTSSTPDFGFDAEYIRQDRKEEEKIIFENIDLSYTGYFTFLVAPEFFVNYEIETVLCNDHTDIPIEVIGGVAPYFIEINGENYKYGRQLEESSYVISGLPAGFYTVMAKDSFGNSFLFELDIPEKEQVNIALKETWIMSDNTEISIIPEVSGPEHISGYEWIKDDNVLSDTNIFTTQETGEYLLKVYTNSGCEKNISFRIISSNLTSDRISIYPNSSERGELFYVDFNLSERQDIEIFIYDMSGREVFKEKLSGVLDNKYSTSLQSSGTYLITISMKETSLVKKIVIR